MSETMTYAYSSESAIDPIDESSDRLFLAHYNELNRGNNSCFFWGKLADPYLTGRCLIALSNTVKSSFNMSPFEMSLLKDPIVTAGNEKVRFEGFSHCAGVYARLDVLPDGHDGEFLENGTTNVDFNQPMINALTSLKRQQQVVLSVGKEEVALETSGAKVFERKVPLPTKWIKGLTTIQIYQSGSEPFVKLNRIQAIQLFRSIPKGNAKNDFFMIQRGASYIFSPVNSRQGLCVGGIHRLRLIEYLVPLADELRVFARPDMQSTTWQLYFGPLRYSLSLSRDTWRGFSGEGAALEALIEDVPEDWVQRLDNFSFANQSFNPTILAIESDMSPDQLEQISSRLAAMGLLGFDVDDNEYFYRRLPYRLDRIMSLNPRLKDAEKLLAEGKVSITERSPSRVEAQVAGSGVKHTVVLAEGKERCTCTWFSKHQGQRGVCKHILAARKLLTL